MIKDILLHVSRSYTAIVEQTEFIGTGDTEFAQLDNSIMRGVFQPVDYTGSILNIDSVSAGTQAYFIAGDGTLWGWGSNDRTLGRNSTDTSLIRSSPVQIGTETNWSSVSAGIGDFAFAIKSNGTLWSWGNTNTNGELGLGDTNNTRSKPTQIGARTDWSKIKAYNGGAIALTSTGELWGWGINTNGQLATSNTQPRSSPVQIGKGLWNDLGLNVLDFDVSIGPSVHVIAVVQNPFDTTNLRNLWGWGMNTSGQLGLNDVVSRSSPVQIPNIQLAGDPSFKRVACGGSHTLAVMEETPGVPNALHRTLWAWGANGSGQLGTNNNTLRSSPVQVGTRTDWDTPYAAADVSYGKLGTTNPGLNEYGQLWTWGWLSETFSFGIGPNDINAGSVFRSSPIQISAPTTNNWSTISPNRSRSVSIIEDGVIGGVAYAAGEQPHLIGVPSFTKSISIEMPSDKIWNVMSISSYTMAIDSAGKLWAWGLNENGNLGTGDTVSRPSPVQIGTETNWADVKTSNVGTTLALKTNGTLWSWGNNNVGILGISPLTGNRSSPVQIGTETNWSRLPKKIDTNHLGAIKTNGTLWTWGLNTNGQLGLGDISNRSAPTQVGTRSYSMVSMSTNHTVAISTDGSLWAWGSNNLGKLGDNSSTQRNAPVQVGARTDWIDIEALESNSIFIRSNRTMWIAGSALSAGGWYDQNYLTYVYDVASENPTYVKGDVGWNHALLLKTDGSLWLWGNNDQGVLGDGSTTYRSLPVQVGTDWIDAACGNSSDGTGAISATGINTFAIRTAGTLWGWGSNSANQLGIFSTSAHRSSPVQIGTLSTWNNAIISAGNASGYIRAQNGTIWSWGSNTNGRLGLNISTGLTRSIPQQIGNRSNWTMVKSFHQHSGAITTNGQLWLWGRNNEGQLGDSTNVEKSSPVQVGTRTDWLNFSLGASHTIAIRDDGTLWSWGSNLSGQLGLDLPTIVGSHRSSPVQIGTETNWSKIGTTIFASFATKTDGSLWAWGNFTQWGDGSSATETRSSPVQVGYYPNIRDIYGGNTSLLFGQTNNTILQNGTGRDSQVRFAPSFNVNHSSPVMVQYTSVMRVNAAVNETTVVTKRTDDRLYAFGSNQWGSYGLGDTINRSSPVQLGHDILHDDFYVGTRNIVMKKTY